MKTRRSASRSGWASSQALRRAATSGLSCSAACAVFFERHGVTVQEPPHRARGERGPVLPEQHLGNLAQRDVDLLLDRRKDDAAIGLNALGAAIAALAPGSPPARLTPSANPAYGTRRRHPEPLGCRPPRHAPCYRRNQSAAQVLRQGFRHVCWPPRPADSVNHIRRTEGIPNESVRSDFALASLGGQQTRGCPPRSCLCRRPAVGRCGFTRLPSSG
jgi:hypothetical protein